MGIISAIIITFCALFIAIDSIGLLPAFELLINNIQVKESKKTLSSSLYAALAIGVGLLVACRIIAWFIGLTTPDFQIAGGLGLFVLTIYYLLKPEAKEILNLQVNNLLPLVALLIIRPSVLMMILVLMSSYGVIITCLSLAANMFMVYIIFKNSDKIKTILADNGIALLSKIADILLCVFAIMLIRKGLFALFVNTCTSNI
jgi:small neutral amino acid transporter SnatA (MarC family)